MVHQTEYQFATLAIHAGQDPDPSTGAVIPAISMATTYKMDAVGAHHVSLISTNYHYFY